MRCQKHEHQPGQKCPAKNAKCKACHKIGHFHKVCMITKRQQGGNKMVGNVQVSQGDPGTNVNMIRDIKHIDTHKGSFHEGKHLKFPNVSHPSRPYDDHLVMRVDTGADVKCMNEITYNELFPEVKLSVCPHEIQNFGNSTADISMLRQFCTYLLFKGKMYENSFTVTDANDCPNLLSHGATLRMGVLLQNYPRSMLVEGDNVPHFKKMSGDKMRAHTSPSNVFQILNEL